MGFIWKLAIFSVIQDFTGFASAINAEFEITFFKCAFYSNRVFDRCPICQNILFLIDVPKLEENQSS